MKSKISPSGNISTLSKKTIYTKGLSPYVSHKALSRYRPFPADHKPTATKRGSNKVSPS